MHICLPYSEQCKNAVCLCFSIWKYFLNTLLLYSSQLPRWPPRSLTPRACTLCNLLLHWVIVCVINRLWQNDSVWLLRLGHKRHVTSTWLNGPLPVYNHCVIKKRLEQPYGKAHMERNQAPLPMLIQPQLIPDHTLIRHSKNHPATLVNFWPTETVRDNKCLLLF